LTEGYTTGKTSDERKSYQNESDTLPIQNATHTIKHLLKQKLLLCRSIVRLQILAQGKMKHRNTYNKKILREAPAISPIAGARVAALPRYDIQASINSHESRVCDQRPVKRRKHLGSIISSINSSSTF
jgi:hypothetical protein